MSRVTRAGPIKDLDNVAKCLPLQGVRDEGWGRGWGWGEGVGGWWGCPLYHQPQLHSSATLTSSLRPVLMRQSGSTAPQQTSPKLPFMTRIPRKLLAGHFYSALLRSVGVWICGSLGQPQDGPLFVVSGRSGSHSLSGPGGHVV